MANNRLIVVGGNAAGMSAAAKARRRNEDLDIVVLERGPHVSYSTCGVPYYAARLVEPLERLLVRDVQSFREQGIDVRLGCEVTELDTGGRRVRIRADGREHWEGYDHLLLATGARAYCPDLPGTDAAGIYGISDLVSGERVRRALDAARPAAAVIVGGGYIGLEMAEALVSRGIRVSLIQRAPQVMSTLDPDMGERVAAALRAAGVILYLNETLECFEARDGRLAEVVTDRRRLATELAVLGIGVRPNSELAEQAGIPLGAGKAIHVNARQQTGGQGVWAAGDCADSFHLLRREPTYLPLGTVANKQGRVAGLNLGGGYATLPGVVGTAITRFKDTEIARTGLTEADCRELGREFSAAVIDTKAQAGYWPGAADIAVKLLAEKGSGRLLGGQIVGGQGSAKRIDTLATALHAGMDVQELIDLDLSYAPPFSGTWDPVQVAARVLLKEL